MGSGEGHKGVVDMLDPSEGRKEAPRPDRPPALHRPVMLAEVLELLCPEPGQKALDLTLGTGGHALALVERLGPDGLLVGMDADPTALEIARDPLTQAAPCPVRLVHARFSAALELASEGPFDVVLADLGMGHQIDDPARGFSFESGARLDMRFDPEAGGPSAWDVVNRLGERELAELFHELGQERYSRAMAAAICRRRRTAPIDTPAELAELAKLVVARRSRRGRTWRIHPATRVAMALRIYVNRELEELDAMLVALPQLLVPGGRAAVLTYHSLEARRVKRAWRRQASEGLIELINRRVLKPSDEETAANRRARSAQLRGARRL